MKEKAKAKMKAKLRLTEWRLRKGDEGDWHYLPNDTWFTIQMHHGGYFANLPWKTYMEGLVDHFDACNMDKISMVDIDQMVEELGYSGFMNYYWTLPFHTMSLEDILRELKTDKDVMDMVYTNLPHEHKMVVYIEKMTPEEMAKQELAYVENIKATLTPPKATITEIEPEDGSDEACRKVVGGVSGGKAPIRKSMAVRRLLISGCEVSSPSMTEQVIDEGRHLKEAEPVREDEHQGVGETMHNLDANREESVCMGERLSPEVADVVELGREEENEKDFGEQDGSESESDNSDDEDYRAPPETESGSCDTEFDEMDNEIENDDDGINVEVQVDTGVEQMMKGNVPTQNSQQEAAPTQNKQQEAGPAVGSTGRVMGYNFKEVQSESEDSDGELLSVHESSDDEGERVPVFNPITDMRDPKFKVKMVFPSFDVFKKAVRAYSVVQRQPVDFKKNDKRRVRVVCKAGCPWLLVAGKYKDGPRAQIRRFEDRHTCVRQVTNKFANYKWIAEEYLEVIRSNPELPLAALVDLIRRDHNIKIHRSKVGRGKTLALMMLRGDEAEQYAKLADYGGELKARNPGTQFLLGLENLLFKRVFICMAACKKGFLSGGRPIISLDGCFLKGRYGGQLLAAVGIDANDCIWPIAYAVVEVESYDSWAWFLVHLAEELGIVESKFWTFMSDRQKGLIPVVQNLFPDAEYRFCVRHLYTNFKCCFPGVGLRNYVWQAARSSYEGEFKKNMEVIKGLDANAWAWLNGIPPEHWTRSSFREFSKCDILLNNLCECFNRFILDARDKPILTMLEVIRCKIMVRIARKRSAEAKWTGKLCPKITKKLNKNIDNSRNCWAMESGGTSFQITTPMSQHVVDIEQRTCSCRKWQLTGIPCNHACFALALNHSNFEEYVDQCYWTETHKEMYANVINPIRSVEQWEDMKHNPIKPPNNGLVSGGRSKMKRRRELGEPESNSKMKKTGVIIHCSICKQKGHNKSTCKSKPTSAGSASSAKKTRKRGGQPSQRQQPSQMKQNVPTSEQTSLSQQASAFVARQSQRSMNVEDAGSQGSAGRGGRSRASGRGHSFSRGGINTSLM